jgi:hypothetical protein
MADLKTSVIVDVSQLANLSRASQEVASATQAMAERFMQSGMSAAEAASALENMGASAREAAIATGTFSSAAEAAGLGAERAAAGVTSMERAMAAADVRVVSSIGGLGGIGTAMARVGAASSTMAPLLASAFPVILGIAFVDVLGTIIDKFAEWERKTDLVAIAWNNLSLAMLSDVDKANRELLTLDERFIGLTQGPVAELQKELADLAISFASIDSAAAHAFKGIDDGLKQAAVSKWDPMLWLNPLRDAKIGTGDLQPLADKIQIALQEALLSKDPEKIFAALDAGLRQMAAKQKEVTDVLAKTAQGDISIPYYQDKLKAIQAITNALRELQIMQVDADAAADKARSVKGAQIQKEETEEIRKSEKCESPLLRSLNPHPKQIR